MAGGTFLELASWHFHHMQRGLNIQCSAAWALGGHILGPPTKMPFKWDFLLMTLMECGPWIYLSDKKYLKNTTT